MGLIWNIFAIIGVITSLLGVLLLILILYFLIKNKIRELRLKKQREKGNVIPESRIGYKDNDDKKDDTNYRTSYFKNSR